MTNLRILKPSRAAPKNGDIFVLSPAVGMYLYGRVIDAKASVGPFPAILVYIYRHVTDQIRALEPAQLPPSLLLIPPVMINRLAWSRGYFETVAHAPITADDRLPVHAFKDEWGRLVDERSRPVLTTPSVVGHWGLSSYRSLDDKISRALGLPMASD